MLTQRCSSYFGLDWEPILQRNLQRIGSRPRSLFLCAVPKKFYIKKFWNQKQTRCKVKLKLFPPRLRSSVASSVLDCAVAETGVSKNLASIMALPPAPGAGLVRQGRCRSWLLRLPIVISSTQSVVSLRGEKSLGATATPAGGVGSFFHLPLMPPARILNHWRQ